MIKSYNLVEYKFYKNQNFCLCSRNHFLKINLWHYFWIRQYPYNSLTFSRHNILGDNTGLLRFIFPFGRFSDHSLPLCLSLSLSLSISLSPLSLSLSLSVYLSFSLSLFLSLSYISLPLYISPFYLSLSLSLLSIILSWRI